MLRSIVFFFALFIGSNVEAARSQYVRCFQRFERKSIDNFQPIAEFFFVTPHQCIDQCIMATNNAIKIGLCKSFVYNHLQHSCRLYDHSGNQIPAIIHPANGYDLYKRTATTQECGGPNQRFFAQKFKHKDSDDFAAKAAAQPIQQIPTPIQFGDTEELAQKPKGPSPVKTIKDVDIDLMDTGAPAARPENEQQKHFDERPNNEEPKKYGANFRVVQRQKPKSQLSESPTIGKQRLPQQLKPAVEYTRPCSTSYGFYLANSTEMLIPQDSIAPTVTFKNVDRQKCLEHCASNIDLQKEPFKCLTLNYAEETKICTLYGILAQPHGQGKLIENTESSYAEKFCLPPSPQKCVPNAVFELNPNKLISQSVIASTTSNSLPSCLQSCLNMEGCLCASFDSNRKQCLLHDYCSAKSQKSLHGWVLVTNGCYPSSIVQQLSTEEWSSWSTCRYKLGSKQSIRIRTRQCNPECAGGSLQIERCTI